jgi:hypothetical protein
MKEDSSISFWLWGNSQIDKHFADICLMVLIAMLLVIALRGVVFRILGWQIEPENVSWARELIAAIVGCLLGCLSQIDSKSMEVNHAEKSRLS